MNAEPLKILHLEDSPNDALLIAQQLEDEFRNLLVVQVDNQEDYLRAIHDPVIRLVLSDYSLPAYDGIRAMSALRNHRPDLPFIFVSGAMGEDMAVECMKIGATDYVLKSNLRRLPSSIRRALSEVDNRQALTEAARVAKVVPWNWNDLDDTWLFGYLVKDILGYSPDVLKSNPGFLKAKVHVDDLPRFVSSFAQSKEKGRLDFDCRLQHLDGGWLWTRWTLAWADGRCRGILQDITELRIAQDALIQSQRLETLGMMIGGITHDFGNLIAAMNGAVDLLASSPLTEPQQRYVELLAKSSGRALEFRNELLRLARKENDPVRLAMDVNEVAQEALKLLRHALPRSMELTSDLCSELPKVLCVPTQILQVLMNLGINARDAMGGQGHLHVRSDRSVLTAVEALELHRPSGIYVRLEVEDTGPGIPPSVLPHIFEPFFTTKEVGKGTGLGLAMARAIVQQHDGLLRVDSVPERGARFQILLPVVEESAPGVP